MEKLLQEWRENAAKKEEVNFRFVRWTKQYQCTPRIFFVSLIIRPK
jgi:hypothetical protein